MLGSYVFEKLEGRHQEASFLAERAKLRLDGFIPLLKRHGVSEEGKILEVGCAQGIRTRLIAENFPRAEVVGLDRSEELLEQARAQSQNHETIAYVHADLYDLPFANETFDFIYARLVFMHLKSPLEALDELKRVLKPGGKILIEDADRDCMFFEPTPPSFASFWEKVQEGQRRLGGDPNVGRRLASYLKTMRFHNLKIETQPIIDGGEQIEFLARTLMPSLNIYLDPKDRPSGEVAIQDLMELSKDPRATFYHFWFAVSGEKAQVTL